MSATTPIEWCDSTVNPMSGCDGCELFSPAHPERATCYAKRVHEQRLARYSWKHYAPSFAEVRMIPGRIADAARWSDLRGKLRPHKRWLDLMPRTIFVGDLGDVMSKAVTDEFVEREIFAPMESEAGRRHVWIVLTKRPQRLAKLSWGRADGLPRNCMAMTTVTDQATADARVPWLLQVKARWHGISAEPLLGPVSLAAWMRGSGSGTRLDWVIAGGESGPGARPCEIEWIRALVCECDEACVPAFVKQFGSKAVRRGEPMELRDPKGGDMGEWPVGMCVRVMPDLDAREAGQEVSHA
jgi:protein gp37